MNTDSRPIPGHPVTVFGHPRAKPLSWTGPCNVIAPATSDFDSSLTDYGRQYLTTCPAVNVISGSALIDDADLSVIGVIWGQIYDSDHEQTRVRSLALPVTRIPFFIPTSMPR